MLLLTMLGLAHAQDAAAAEDDEPIDWSEIVLVWPDKFARWRDTRWWVGMELLYPIGLVLAAEENASFRTVALQAKAVIACDQEYTMGRKRLEVGCEIEDIAVRATSVNRFATERGRKIVQRVLDDIDDSLTGAKITLQVNDRGAITNIGLDGLEDQNARERLRAETLRQVLARLIVPFHMKLPKSGVREGQWVEYDSDLMTMPASDASQGSSMIAHYMNFYQGHLLVQDIGAGQTMIRRPPAADWRDEAFDDGTPSIDAPQGTPDIGVGAIGADSSVSAANPSFRPPGSVFEVPLGYRLDMNGVSIYNVDNGVMEERVWSMVGRPYAQNPGNLKLWYTGRIQLLGADDKPDLGPSEQVGYPEAPIPGLPPWTPVDPELAKTLASTPPPTRRPSRK